MPSPRFSIVAVLVALAGALAACAGQPSSRECSTGIVCPAPLHCAAAEAVCISNSCGDAIVEAGEECDDGNIEPGDGCSPTCKIERCGNGILDPGELCDLGEGVNGTCKGCSADCKSNETCGNNVVEPECGEVCDNGPNPTNACNGCDESCHSTQVCGNHIVDTECGEVCDEGPTGGAGCSSDCRSTKQCGNGTVDPGEECDDGLATNNNDFDCRADCVINRCGDGWVDSTGTHHEDCDAGPQAAANSRVAVPTESTTCNLDCTAATCGDGKVNQSAGEQCDHGLANNADTKDCTAGCKVNVCGDGRPDTAGPLHIEACDTGSNSQTCNLDCTVPACGDGKVNHGFTPTGAPGPEQCDDGNTVDGDGCSHLCQLEHCGNGVIDAGEQCDGAPVNGFTCAADCHLEKCGNGILDPGEQCDDGNASDLDDCLSSSPIPANCKRATCGDGKIDAFREQCDDGPTNGMVGDPCSATCQTVVCGNGVVEQGEQCDLGSGKNGDTLSCTSGCQNARCGDGLVFAGVEQCDSKGTDSATCNGATCTNSVCGDGHKNTAAGEACDDGNKNGTLGDPCDSTCHLVSCGNGIVEPNEQCDPGTGSPATDSATCNFDCTLVRCGDNHTNTAAGETCDDGATQNAPCAYGTPTCTKCNSTCTGTFTQTGPYCGDSIVDGSETCDQGSQNGVTSCAYGTASCMICSATCGQLVSRTGNVCGDGLVDASHENCDDGNALGCGLCSSDCRTATAAAIAATGEIVTPAGSSIGQAPNQTFTLNDGYGKTVVFEFTGASPSGTTLGDGNTAVNWVTTNTASQMATEIQTAITTAHGAASPLAIRVTSTSGGIVYLANDHLSSLGNQAIGNANAGTGWGTFGMSGGAGGACAAGIACKSNGDCKSGTCLGTNLCQ